VPVSQPDLVRPSGWALQPGDEGRRLLAVLCNPSLRATESTTSWRNVRSLAGVVCADSVTIANLIELPTRSTQDLAGLTHRLGLVRGGVFKAVAGKAWLLGPADLAAGWDPAGDERISVWEVVIRLAKALAESGPAEAARLMAAAGQRVDLDTAKELAYLLYSICERKGWAPVALLFNGLGTSWNYLEAAARRPASVRAVEQATLDLGGNGV
jgi:hypothetical protein